VRDLCKKFGILFLQYEKHYGPNLEMGCLQIDHPRFLAEVSLIQLI